VSAAPQPASVPALRLDSVSCTFAAREPGAAGYTAIDGVDLEVGQGEFVAVVGPTGCGKSTLLNLAAGLIAPSAGEVQIGGTRLHGLNRHAGYLFQNEALMPWRTALANVTAGLEFRRVARTEAVARAQDWLQRVGLGAHAGKYPHELSGGMRKRVALAQTLILDPRMLLMDEPFSALDVQTRALMENELLALWSQDRKSVVFVTHDLEEAICLSDRVVVMSAGPASRPIGEFTVALPRPRDVAEVRLTPEFLEIHGRIWSLLRDEVRKAHEKAMA
jgi:NitT/TauT family transport system ATP-binding protein